MFFTARDFVDSSLFCAFFQSERFFPTIQTTSTGSLVLALSRISKITTPLGPEDHETHSYFTYVISVGENRDLLAKFLLDRKIYTTLRYHPLHLNPLYESDKILKNSEELNEKSLSLPIHPNLSLDQAQYIVDNILEFYKGN